MSIKILLLLLILFLIVKNFAEEEQKELLNNTSIPLDVCNQLNWKHVITDEETAKAIIARLRSNTTECPVVTMTTPEIKIKLNKSSRNNQAVSFFNAIMNGSIEDIKRIPFKQIEQTLYSLTLLPLPLQKKLSVWEIFKRNRPVDKLKRKDWEMIGDLILHIPENDLFQINVSNWDIIDYLGTLSTISNRKAMLIAYSIKCILPNVLMIPKYLNRIKGIICGFSSRDLKKIPQHTLLKIKPKVFNNLWACTTQQIRVLLELCMTTYVYGYMETWDEDTLEHLGFLILGLTPEQIKIISPEITYYLSDIVLNKMDYKQIQAFTPHQVLNFNDAVKTVYNYKFTMDIASSKDAHLLNNVIFICTLPWLLF